MIYPINNESIDFAESLINNGEIIAYPTDTLYGFGVDATNSKAINKLNLLKGRIQPLSIIVSNIKDINQYAIISNEIKKYLTKYLPGPYTLLLPKNNSNLSDLSDLITYDSKLVGIRIPKHNFPIELVKKINKPIVTSSINQKDRKPLNLTDKIEENYPEISIFEDQKQELINSIGSTIIKLNNNEIELIRQGDGDFPL